VQVVAEDTAAGPGWVELLGGRPIWLSVAGLVVLAGLGLTTGVGNVAFSVGALALVAYLVATLAFRPGAGGQPGWHRLLEGRPMLFSVLVLIAVLIGGVAELVPTLVLNHKLPDGEKLAAVPYRPLELHGRDIYVREGCYNCHSQMIRPMQAEAARYGEPSTVAESFYDHPFQWGSKRTGPDLARVGVKYPNLWHLEHFKDPRSISPGSNMPSFAWMVDKPLNIGSTAVKLAAMRSLGVPYTSDQVAQGEGDLEVQAKEIAADLAKSGQTVRWDSEIVALIAYMQRLGKPATPASPPVSLNTPPQVP
jgi:cytochrome c oxidase cbb3-type subunit I/II